MPEARRFVPIAAIPVVGAVIFLGLLPQPVQTDIGPLLRNIGSGAFLMAGVLRMAAWRLTRDPYTAWLAVLLLVVGTVLPSTSVLYLYLHDGPIVRLEAPEARLMLLVPILVLALVGARHGTGLVRSTLATMGAVTVAGATIAIMIASPARTDRHPGIWLALEIATTSVWTALAMQARSRRLAGGTYPTWTCTTLALMAISDALKGWSIGAVHAPHGVSTGTQLLAAAIALAGAARDLSSSLRSASVDASTLTRALVDTQHRLDRIEELQRQRLHDARSAVVGVVGASDLLAEPGTLGTVDTARLRGMVVAELDRLQGLLRIEDEPIAEFDVATAIAGVVESHRLSGLAIELDVHGVHAVGQAQATATVVDNLLRNAQRHAPGSRVKITATAVAGLVEIAVSDDGPGIPAAERAQVLLAGVRGSTARGAGSGLGLFSASQAMRAQAGSLQIAAHSGGGTEITIWLPAALCAAVAGQR